MFVCACVWGGGGWGVGWVAQVAISWGQVEMARLMIERGASTSVSNSLKQSPLDLASPGRVQFADSKASKAESKAS